MLKDDRNPVLRSVYAPQLFQWLQMFPPSQFLVIQSEQLYAKPAVAMARVTTFMGIRSHNGKERLNFGAVIGSTHNLQLQKRRSQAEVRMVAHSHADP